MASGHDDSDHECSFIWDLGGDGDPAHVDIVGGFAFMSFSMRPEVAACDPWKRSESEWRRKVEVSRAEKRENRKLLDQRIELQGKLHQLQLENASLKTKCAHLRASKDPKFMTSRPRNFCIRNEGDSSRTERDAISSRKSPPSELERFEPHTSASLMRRPRLPRQTKSEAHALLKAWTVIDELGSSQSDFRVKSP